MARPKYCLHYLCMIIGVVFWGCSGSNPTSDEGPSDTEILNSKRFPLSIGNHWEYKGKTEDTIISKIDTTITSFDFKTIWDIVSKDTVFGVESFKMAITEYYLSGPDSGKVSNGYDWYTMRGDTLKAVACLSTSSILMGQLYKITHPANDIVEWNVNILVFPLTIGKRWILSPDLDFLGEKNVVSEESVSLPNIGKIKAFRIIRTLDFTSIYDDSYENYNDVQLYSSIGLIQVNRDDVMQYNSDNFVKNDKIIKKEIHKIEYDLVSYKLH